MDKKQRERLAELLPEMHFFSNDEDLLFQCQKTCEMREARNKEIMGIVRAEQVLLSGEAVYIHKKLGSIPNLAGFVYTFDDIAEGQLEDKDAIKEHVKSLYHELLDSRDKISNLASYVGKIINEH